MSFEVDLDSAVLESDYYKDDTANKPERKSTGFSPEAGPAKQPAPFSVDLESAELDEKASQGFLGTLIDGTKSAARSVGATVDTYAGDAQGVVDKAKTQNEQRNDINLDRFNADIAKNTGMGGDEETGLWDSVKGVGKAIIDNPKGAGLAVVEQFPNAVPALAGGYAGMKTGAAVGAAAGAPFAGVGAGPGAFIGGIVGGLSGMFLGNTLIETGGKALEYAQDGEFTPEEMSKTKKEGAVKAGVITGIDALTLGVGGKISSSMQRTVGKSIDSATRKALLDAGVDISDAAALAAARSNPVIAKKVAEAQQNAAKISDTLRRRGVELGTLLTVESVGEGLGEYLGELAATGEASIPEAVLESFLSLGQSSVETMFNFSRAREKSLTEQEWVDAANGIAPEGMPQEDMPVADGIWGEPTPEAKIDMGQMQEGGVTPSPVFEPQDIDRNLGPTPSQQMGINPDDGPLSAAAAQSVDSGLFTGGFTPQASINQAALEREGVTPPPVLDTDQIDRNLGSIDPITGEYIPAPERIGQQAPEKTTGNYEYDQWGNLNKVDGRAVDGYDAGQPRLGFNSKAERSTAPMYEVSPDGVARPTSGESARSMKERVDLSGLDRGKQQTQPQQAQQQQAKPARTPEQDAQSIWNSLNSFERNAAVADTLGMRGVPAKAVAARNWEALSKKQKEKLVGNLTAKQGSRWTDPNQKATDQSGPVLQNRDRTSHDSIMQMRGISNNPDYNRLKTSGFLSDGAPVVINEKIQIPESQLGVTDTASAGDQKFNVQYAAVEADQLATSNNIDGTVNPDYATGPDGKARAIAGNGRVTGLQSAWAKGKADQYKTDMASDKMHGIDPAVIKGMKNPVLVRLLPQDQVTDNIGDLSNRDEKGKLSPVEQAKTDMGRIDLDSLKFTTEGAIGGEAIHQFRMAQPAAERVSEAEARKRLTSAIFQKAYGNDQLTEIQAGESEDAKSIMSALAQAAPSMSRLEGAGEYDVRPLIAQAGIAAVNAARRGAKLADYVQQSEMGIDPIVYPILEMMLNENGNIRSSKYIGEQLTNMAKLAYDEANSPSSDMFGEKPKRTGEQVIQDALTGVQGYGQINDGRGQESLGQRGRPESDAQMAEGPEGGRERPADTGQAARAQPEAEQGQPATVENEVPEKWRSNYLQAAKVARDLGIDPKQHKKLADLVAAIDAFNAEPVASQPQQQVAAAKPAANNKTSVHIDNAIDLTSALAAIARGAQLSTEPNGDVILSGAKIITLPKQPTSANEVIGALAVALRDQMRADGVSMPGNPADMTRDQFVVAYEFANIIPEFEITGEDIGGVVQGSSSGLTVDADKLYDKIIEQAKEQANPALELNQQTEETLAQDAERLEQLQKEEAAQKAKQKAAESKARERDADKARADEVVDDFQLGQPAEDAMSGMDDIFATESKSAKENTSKNTAPQTGLSIKSHDADIDTFNNWSKNVYESVAGWRLFDRSSERFGADISLFRKIKKANAAGGGYVSAQLIKGFSSVEEARAWAKENKVTISMPTVEIKTNKAEDKTKASADKQTTPKAPTEAIKDYGEKMAGAIKDQPKTSLSENLTDEDIASQALSKIWPAKEVMESDDDFIAAFAYAARSRIPAKPRVKYKIDRWVRTVQGSRRFAQAAATGRITIESLNRAATRAESGLEEYANQVKLLMQIDRKDWGRIGDIHDYSKAYRFDDEGNKQPSPHISVNIDGVITKIDGATTIEETFSKVKNVISKDSKAASKNDPRQFEIRTVRSTGEIFINRKGDKEYRELKSFKKGELAAARDFVRNNTDDLAAAWEAVKERDNVSKADVRGDTNAERAGKDYRNGKDVTSEEFGETFGFRGVEFGNWVSQGKGQADRQGMLNAAYDALLDLASIVGVPPKAISLNGSLGIAFGSRGKGKASAHYETDNIVINLTKTKGAGSLAHEWFHALDNYFSRSRGVTPFDGNNAAYNKANYITYKPEPMMALKTSLNKKGIRPYLITKAEYDRRVERGVNFDAADWTPDTNHPAGVRPKVEKAFAGLVNELDKSPMLARAEKIDKGKVDGYWSSIIERAARSFESYVIAKLEQQGQSNDYLANVVPITSFKRDEGRYPYLTDEELKPVAEKFDVLFNTIEAKEGKDGNVLLFSFAGKAARGADLMALDQAQLRIASGDSAETVRQETSWHRGDDGKWRFEISDDQAKLRVPGKTAGEVIDSAVLDAISGNRKFPVTSDLIDHAQLFVAYPKLSNIKVEKMPAGGTALARLQRRATGFTIQLRESMPREKVASAILHELQHGIQVYEGFAVGGSKNTVFSDLDVSGAKAYRLLAGEVEARNTQTRQTMTPNLRRNIAPEFTQDTASSDVIVTFNGKDITNKALPNNANGATITNASLIRAFDVQFPRLTKAVRTMLARGNNGERGGVVVIDSADPLMIARAFSKKTGRSISQSVQMFSDAGVINGFFDPKSGLTFLVGPNLNPVTGTAVLLHEMIHGQQRQKIDKAALAMLMNRGKEPDVETRAFLDRVAARMVDAGEAANAQEAGAYIVEQAVMEGKSAGYGTADSKFLSWVDQNIGKKVGNFLRSFIGNVRSWALRNGMPIGPITVDDLVSYAMAGMEQAGRGNVDGGTAGFSRDAITNTPAFKKWFGDSKVVDANGDPKVLYHGTASDISAFKGMVWGSENADLANDYAFLRGQETEAGEVIMPLYMSAQAPFDSDLGLSRYVTAAEFFNAMVEQAQDQGRSMSQADIARLSDLLDVVDKASKREESGPDYRRHSFWNYPSMSFGDDGAKAIQDALKLTGFDSIKMIEDGQVTYGAFKSEQVKSATGNNGDFDGANPDIRYSKKQAYNPNQGNLFAELEKISNDDPYAKTKQRPGTTEKQRELGRSALTDFFRWLKNSSRAGGNKAGAGSGEVSLLGASIYKDFQAGKPYQLIGQTIESPKDLAALAQVYRDPRFETFRAFFVDKDGKIILEQTASTRMPASVSFSDDLYMELNRSLENSGADKFYIMHNHPSGVPTPSPPDIAMTEYMGKVFGKKMAGHVVIDHNSYAVIDENGNVTEHQDERLAGIDFSSNPEVDHASLNKQINSPDQMALVAKQVANSDTPILVVTKAGAVNRVGLIASVPMELLNKGNSDKRDTKFTAAVRRMIRAAGAGGALFVVLPKSYGTKGEGYHFEHGSLQWMHEFAQDVVDSDGNSVIFARHQVSIDDYASISIKDGRISKQTASMREESGVFDGSSPDISFSKSQVKTETFKKAFGKSKVVDSNGEPLLVYHGSGAKFATFDKSKRGATTRAKSAEEGFFFTSSKSLAYDFKKQAEGAAADLDAIRGAVEGLSDSQLESLASDIGRIASEDLDLEGRDFFIDSLMDMYQHDTDINTWPEESNGTPKALKNYIPKDILEPGAIHDVYLRIENPHEHVFDEDDDWHDEGAITRAISTAQKNGNDGVILRNMVDVARADEKGNNAIRSDVYIAFEPDQIIQSEDSAGIRFSRAANPASVNAAPNGMAAWDSPSASKFDDFVYKIQDKHVDTKRVIAAIRDTGKAISDDLDVYLQETLFHGRAAKRTQDFLNMEVNPLIEYMQSAKVDMSDLEEFLHARHAQEANALIAKRDPNMPDGGSGMTNAEAAKYLKSLNGVRRKQFENAAKMVDKIIGGTRETIVDYGLESQDTVDGWANGFKHYIPLQREDKDGQMGIGQGFSVKGKETKSRTGSTRKVVDILANVMMQRERIIVRGEKNRVAVAALGLAKDNPLPDFWQVDKVPTTRVLDKTTGLVRNQADPMYKSRDNAIVAKVNGQEHAILMNEDDPRAMRMAEALKNLDAAQLEGLLGATATATRYFAAVNTQYNPIFGVTNFVRDIQEAMLHLQSTPLAGQQARLFKNTFTAVGAVMKAERDGRKGNNATGKWGVLWEDFQNTGGQTGFRDQFSSSADRGEAIKSALTPDGWADTGLGKLFTAGGVLKAPLEAVRKKAAWMFDLLSDYNTAMENGVRLSAYETGINAGMSKEQAAALAKGLTVNFNRKGQVTQQVGALYAFFNASVQGSARLGQSLFDMEPGKPKTMRLSKLGKRIVSGGVLLGASQAVLLAMMGFDDDEPPEFIRERNIIIPTGDKTYISIPMPLGYHVIANLGRIPTEFALSGGKDGAKYLFNLMDVMADIYNPIGNSGLSMQTIAPTVLDPLAGLAENKDFSGRAIAKESFNRQTPGHALARDTASLPATWLAELVNYATGGTEFTRGELSPTPDQIDYLVGQLTGGVGRETTKFMKSIQATATGDDLPWHNIPLAGRFFGDADSDGAKQSAFYNSMDKVRKHAEEVKGLRASGRSGEAVEYANKHPHAKLHLAARAAEKQVKDMRDRKRDLEQAGAPREEIRALEQRMIKRMEQFVELSAVRK